MSTLAKILALPRLARRRAVTVAAAVAVAAGVLLTVPQAQAATDTTPPSVPTGLIASVSCTAVLSLSWTASTDNVGVTGYDVFREVSTGTFALAGTTTTTTYTEQRLASIRYQVRARDAAGNTSAFTAPVTAVPPPCPAVDTLPPTTPGTPTVAVTCGSATLTWTPSSDNFGVTGYEVWQAPTSSGPFSQIATTTVTSFTTTTIAFSYMQVRARDAAGNRSPFTPPVTVVVPACPSDGQAPTTPGTPVASTVTASQISLSWAASTDNIGVAGYDIYRAPGASGGTFAPVGTSTATSFTNTGLTAATTYRYQVRARDAAGNTSAFTPAITVTTTGGGGGGCVATLALQNGWSGGYVMQPNTVTNTGTATVTGWTVTFTLPAGHTVTGSWNAAVTIAGQTVTARGIAGQNAILGPGATTTWGLQASRPSGDTAVPSGPTCASP